MSSLAFNVWMVRSPLALSVLRPITFDQPPSSNASGYVRWTCVHPNAVSAHPVLVSWALLSILEATVSHPIRAEEVNVESWPSVTGRHGNERPVTLGYPDFREFIRRVRLDTQSGLLVCTSRNTA